MDILGDTKISQSSVVVCACSVIPLQIGCIHFNLLFPQWRIIYQSQQLKRIQLSLTQIVSREEDSL